MSKHINKKTLKLGAYYTVLSVVVIAVVIAVNLLVGELPSTLTKFDTSSSQLYTLGEQSESIARNLSDEVNIYLIAQTGYESTTIVDFVNRYTALNSHIKFKQVDPLLNPKFVSNYTDSEVSSNSLIVESAKRSYVIDYYDIFTTEYTDEEIYMYQVYGYKPTGTEYFNGESALTGALDYVTSDKLPKLYIIGGHGEGALTDTILDYIKKENLQTEELTLLSVESIPEDTSGLLINTPASDITESEKNVLLEYLAGGGRLLLTTNLTFSAEKMPNLAEVAASYGLAAEDGLILEGSGHYYGYPTCLLPELNASNPIAAQLPSTNIAVVAIEAHGIKKTGEGAGTVTPLLTTSDSSFIKKDYTNIQTAEKEEGDVDGPFYIGASVSDDTTGSAFVWFSTPIHGVNADANTAVFLSSLTWMCGKTESISISAKLLSTDYLVISDALTNVISTVTTVILPIGIAVCGFAVWYKRKKR